MSDCEYLDVFRGVVGPVAAEFQPEMVLVSSGFDCLAGDTLGSMRLSPSGVYRMTRFLVERVCPRCVVVVEGGYNLRNVALASEAVLRALVESAPPQDSPGGAVVDEYAARWHAVRRKSRMLVHQTEATIDAVRRRHAPYWECFRK
jgi:histone deacetylase 6